MRLKQVITLIIVSLSLLTFSQEKVENTNLAEKVKWWAKELRLFSAPHLAENSLPVIFKRVLNTDPTAQESKDPAFQVFKRAVIQYIDFNNFIVESAENELENVLSLLKRTQNEKEVLILASILYASERVKFIPIMTDVLIKAKLGLSEVGFYEKFSNELRYDLHNTVGYSATCHDTLQFYCPQDSAYDDFTRSFWGLNFGSSESLLKHIKKYEKVTHPVRQLWVQFNRANILETGLPDRQKIETIRKNINSLPKLTQLLAYIVLSKKEPYRSCSIHNQFSAVSDLVYSVFNELGKMPENKIDILITPRELLFLLSQTPKKEIEEFLLGKSSIKDPDLAKLPMNNTRNFFYVVAAEYIVLNRKVVWTEEEFTKFKSSALPEVLKYILDAADL